MPKATDTDVHADQVDKAAKHAEAPNADKKKLDDQHAADVEKLAKQQRDKQMVGEIVLYRDEHPPNEDVPAIVQRVNADGSFRLWVFGANLILMVDDVKQGQDNAPTAKRWTKRGQGSPGQKHPDHLDPAHTSVNPPLGGGGAQAPDVGRPETTNPKSSTKT
jgi:hypothetical protein